jgi:diacylglycerol kinase family enzyme
MTLFYERIVRLGDITLRWSAPDGESHEITRKFVLCAMGVSGDRTYGDHKPILPGFENLCAIETAGVFQKIKLKGILYKGAHPGSPIVHMATTRRLVVDYDGRIPIQLDGEARWVEPHEFPLEIELQEDSVPVLRMD